MPAQNPNSPVDGDRSSLTVAALAIAPAAVGCALGLILSNHLRRRYRAPVATAFLAAGAAAVVPAAIDVVNRLVRGPQSRHGANRTLEDIRSHDGFPYTPAGEEDSPMGDSTMVDFPRVAQPEG